MHTVSGAVLTGDTANAMRVLVVDDECDITDVLVLLLALEGHSCRDARTGHQALAVAAEFDPDVVVIDIGLPDLSGYDVARALRQRPGHQPFLVALTGWGQPDDQERAYQAGFDRHVVKPVTIGKLRQVLGEAGALMTSGR